MPQVKLSEGETKFFESGGSDTAGLHQENAEIAPRETSDDNSGEQLGIAPAEETPEQKQTRETKEAEVTAKAEREKKRKEAIEGLGLVPLEALQEARNEGKLTKRQLEELQAWKQQVEPLLSQLPKPNAKPAEPNPYDPNVQPAEYKAYQEWLDTKQSVNEFKLWKQEQEQRAQQTQQLQAAASWASTQEAEFAKIQPNYQDAFKYAEEHRLRELQAMGMNPQQAQAVLQQNRLEIVGLAMQTGKNPGQIVWDIALQRGFNPENKGHDKAAQAAAKIQAGQRAAGGLNGGGSTPKGEMTLEDINRMPTKTPAQRKAYNEAWTKYWDTR